MALMPSAGAVWNMVMTEEDGTGLITSGKGRQGAKRGQNIVKPGEGRRDDETRPDQFRKPGVNSLG